MVALVSASHAYQRSQPTMVESEHRASTSSVTIKVMYHPSSVPAMQDLARTWSKYGELARVDLLGAVEGQVLVTYFDIRSARLVHSMMPGEVASAEPLMKDYRSVRMGLEVLPVIERLAELGDVENVELDSTEVVVHFYDMRPAHDLVAKLGGGGRPWMPASTGVAEPLLGAPLSPKSPKRGQTQTMPQPPPGLSLKQTLSLSDACFFPSDDGADPRSPTSPTPKTPSSPTTKVTNKEFPMFDIDSIKIENGSDTRTTVMVRNLTAANPRQDCLLILEACGVGNRYNFVYAPCRDNKAVGFAFVDFYDPSDVLQLYNTLLMNISLVAHDGQPMTPAISYARQQGQDALGSQVGSPAIWRGRNSEVIADLEKRSESNSPLSSTTNSSPCLSGMGSPVRIEGHRLSFSLNSTPPKKKAVVAAKNQKQRARPFQSGPTALCGSA